MTLTAPVQPPQIIEKNGLILIGFGDQFKANQAKNDNNEGDPCGIATRIWPQFLDAFSTIPNKLGQGESGYVTYGVCQMLPEKGPDHFLYHAAVEVEPQSVAPVGMDQLMIEKQLYAVFLHDKGLDRLSETLEYIWASWLPQSIYAAADTPSLEVYPSDYTPESSFEIWIPVFKKS